MSDKKWKRFKVTTSRSKEPANLKQNILAVIFFIILGVGTGSLMAVTLPYWGAFSSMMPHVPSNDTNQKAVFRAKIGAGLGGAGVLIVIVTFYLKDRKTRGTLTND